MFWQKTNRERGESRDAEADRELWPCECFAASGHKY